MAVAIQVDYEGGTLAQYDDVTEKLLPQLPEGGAGGALYHWCAATDSGIRIVDVWESKADFDAFYTELLRPITVALGLPEPTISVLELHNHFAG